MGKGIVVPIDNPEKVVKASNCKMSDGQTSVEDALIYSLTEQKIGRWLDGDHYRKVIDFGTLPNATVKSVPHNISNLKHFTRIEAIAWRADGVTTPIPTALPANASYSMELTANPTNVTISTGYNYSAYTSCYVTLEYTKTS